MVKNLCLLLFSTVALTAGEVKFMFGQDEHPEDQEKFLDFRYVSLHDPVFSGSAQLQGWNYRPRGAATSSHSAGTMPADTLLEHGIACRKGVMTIPFKAPSAFVRVWIGDWFAGWRRLWGTDPAIFLKANGKTVYEKKMTSENSYREWCRLEDYVFRRQDDIWDRLVKPVLEEITFEVSNPQGQIRFEMNNLLLTAMVIAPDRKKLNEITAAVEKERRLQFAKRYPWKPQKDEPMPQTAFKDFLLFQKHGLDNIHPWSRPKAGEITDTIKVFAARGEQEMMRFGILPLQNLRKLVISVGDFKGKNGIISSKQYTDLWRERYKERGSEGTKGKIDALWRLNPLSYVFQDNCPQDAEAGTPRMYVLDVTVPENTAAGDYYAPLTISADGKVLRQAKLYLKVLPFKLQYKGSAVYNFQCADALPWAAWYPGCRKEEIKQKIAARVKFLDKYNFYNSYFCPWGYRYPTYFRYGKITGKSGERQFTITPEQEANWDWWFGMIKPNNHANYVLVKGGYLFMNCGWRITNVFSACRLNRFTPAMQKQWENDLKDVERITRQITEHFRKRGYPEFYWYFTGELDNYGIRGTQEAVRMAQAVRRAGAISLVTINGSLAYKAAPAAFDHVWANPATPVDEELKAAVEKYGHKFGTHNSGDTRFQAGFQFWRTGGEGRHQETQFYTDFMLPYVYLPWNYNTAQVYPAPDGSERPSLPFLNYRDGRDDYLYMFTLECAMKKADPDSEAYKDAAAFIDHMKKKIFFDPRKYHTEKFDGIEATAAMNENEWNATSIERYRWQIARLIMNLEKKQ